jgi:hypothetical protein
MTAPCVSAGLPGRLSAAAPERSFPSLAISAATPAPVISLSGPFSSASLSSSPQDGLVGALCRSGAVLEVA